MQLLNYMKHHQNLSKPQVLLSMLVLIIFTTSCKLNSDGFSSKNFSSQKENNQSTTTTSSTTTSTSSSTTSSSSSSSTTRTTSTTTTRVTTTSTSSTTSTTQANGSIPASQLFILSTEERALFTPPAGWDIQGGWSGWEGPSLKVLWEAFNEGRYPTPLDPNAGPSSWYNPEPHGSLNHALLWIGASALGHGLAGNVQQFDNAAQKALTLLSFDRDQGHMRQEAIGGYIGFWEGGIATMALAGFYAPQGSQYGTQLLAAARAWWNDHIATLRLMRFPDGQIALLGARISGQQGDENTWSHTHEVNMQLLDPLPFNNLHSVVSKKLKSNGVPKADGYYWLRPRHVAETWIVLRALRTGAIKNAPNNHQPNAVAQNIYRWTSGSKTHIATPAVMGLGPVRWHVSWTSGQKAIVELGQIEKQPGTGRGPHLPPTPLQIPQSAVRILGH